ncbi:tyrosine--tRNA ligase [Candidatus Saccharibacteria bacterium]|nr:tyrosine--tRNA ligase [Candidatus Saccharibacteria bacterium]
MSRPDIDDLLSRNVEEIIGREELEKKLKSGKKLRIKLGFDPTGSRLHIGRGVTLWKLRQFQDLGHKITFVIGDFTAQIGDSSDKDAERQMLTLEEVKKNFKDYHDQLSKILDMKKVELFHNGSWFNPMHLDKFFKLASLFTIQQMTERDNFAKRIEAGKPVGLHETLYPLFQGYDSVEMKTDLEVGGSDQLFNMLAGRTVQKAHGMEPQAVMTFSLLEGTDGRKMSTSWGNCIYITDEPLEMYGKVMTIRDELIPAYFKAATDMTLDQIEQIEKDLANGDNPRDTKASLARHIVARYHGEEAAVKAEEAWSKQFREGKLPDDIPTFSLKKKTELVNLIHEVFGVSLSEAKRLVGQGGVKFGGKKMADPSFEVNKAGILQVGKRRYAEIVKKN